MANRAGEGTCAGTLSCRVPEGQYSGGSGYVDNRFGWAGYLWDPVLEVYHVRHRVYDPADGRWLQPDPIGHAGGWNLYEYGAGDYANTIDPWGLEPGERAFRASLALVSPEAHRLELDARRQFQVESYRRLQGPVEFVFGAGEVLYGIVSGAPQFIVALATDPIGTIGGIPAAVVHGVQALINDVRGATAGTDPGSGAELSAAERARRAGRAAANAVLVAFSGAKAAEWASNVVRPTRGAAPPAPAAAAAAAAGGSSVQSITSGCAAGATVGSRLLAGTGASRLALPSIVRFEAAGVEHIMRRHGPRAGTADASHFAAGMTHTDIKALVHQVANSGAEWHIQGSRRVLNIDIGRLAGTDPLGNPTTWVRVVTESDGSIVTAYPIPRPR